MMFFQVSQAFGPGFSIIIQKVRIEMQELKCPLCKNLYSQQNPPRLLTMCGHTYCHNCIKTFIRKKQLRYCAKCPQDHLTLNVDSSTPSHFPRNMALLEALRRRKRQKQDQSEVNQFIPCGISSKKSSIQSKRSLLDEKQCNMAMEMGHFLQGICLLHRKPLDIVCIEQRIHICAQCALFGMHKGHHFSTIKEIGQRKKQWEQNVELLTDQKKTIQTKILSGEIEKEIYALLQRKKDILADQLQSYMAKVVEKVRECERKLKQELQKKMNELESEITFGVSINPLLEGRYSSWAQRAEEKRLQLSQQTEEELIILNEEDDNFLSEGTQILQGIKGELIHFWSKVQSMLEYPKLVYDLEMEKQLSKILQFLDHSQKLPKTTYILDSERTSPEDCSIFGQRKDFPVMDDVSLLDISAGFRFQHHQEETAAQLSQISLVNDTIDYQQRQKCQRSQIILPNKTLKKSKSRELILNVSLINCSDKKIEVQSPKQKQKTQYISRKFLTSPTSPKSKLRKYAFRVKDPQKFQKITSGLEADTLETVDLTGFEMGDEIAKAFCARINECKKPKMIRLMKNNLSDDSAEDVVSTLKIIDYLNLAQNCFTQRILLVLVDYSSRGVIGKGKTVQLGQNKLNSRRLKEKIDELKGRGIIITL